MTMTMTEIGGPETGIDHIVETDCKTIIEMNIEMTIEKKITGISKTRSIREGIVIINYENTYEDRYDKDNYRNCYKDKNRNKNKD